MATISATKGDTSANSYVTVEEADAFFDSYYGYEEWTSIDSATKIRLLITATYIVDGMPIKYDKLDAAQALAFPVLIDLDSDDGFANAKKATFYQAYYLYQMSDAISEARVNGIQGIQQERIQKNGQNITGFNQLKKFAPDALRAMSKYVDFSFKIARG